MGEVVRSRFNNAYSGERVLITGDTGFKGSWLCCWLLSLGAEVVGVANGMPTYPAMFEVLGLGDRISHYNADIRDLDDLRSIFEKERPRYVFHLAAQAIVSQSYENPVETITTNVVGTAHILELLRGCSWPCVAIIITSDKCYDNVEWEWGYRETNPLGGKDIYSGSKGAAELVIKSYTHSFFQSHPYVRLSVARAGNVIGGGDWAKDRIVADAMRAWSLDSAVRIRNPKATRPWQHVLEPLSGYLQLGSLLSTNPQLSGEAFNFGPRSDQRHSVVRILEDLAYFWGWKEPAKSYSAVGKSTFHEAGLLKLNCDKALHHLDWKSTLEYGEMIEMVAGWYSRYYRCPTEMFEYTMKQIARYEHLATLRGCVWIQS